MERKFCSKHDHRGARERLLELQDVADVGPAPLVDRLVGVAYDADVAVDLAQQVDDLVLGVVGVLELVHQNLAEAVLVGLPDIVAGLQQVGGHHQEIVEVERIGRQQALLVNGVDVGDLALEGVGSWRADSRNVSKSISSDLAWPMTAATERGGSRFVSSPISATIISMSRRVSVSS